MLKDGLLNCFEAFISCVNCHICKIMTLLVPPKWRTFEVKVFSLEAWMTILNACILNSFPFHDWLKIINACKDLFCHMPVHFEELNVLTVFTPSPLDQKDSLRRYWLSLNGHHKETQQQVYSFHNLNSIKLSYVAGFQ